MTNKKDKFEVLIPPKGVSFRYLLLLLPFLLTNVVLGFMAFIEPTMIAMILYPLMLGIYIINGILPILLFSPFGYTRLYINREKIKITYELFGIKFNRQPSSSKNDICKLEIVGRTIDKSTKGHPEIPSRLIIWAGNRSYEIGKIVPSLEKEYLTSPEIDWLAQELSHFLELPISRDTVFTASIRRR